MLKRSSTAGREFLMTIAAYTGAPACTITAILDDDATIRAPIWLKEVPASPSGGKSANRWRTTSATSSISRANSCPRSRARRQFAVNRHTIRRAMVNWNRAGWSASSRAAAPSCRNMPSTTPSASARAFREPAQPGRAGAPGNAGSQTLRAADIAKHLGLPRNPLLRVHLAGKAETGPSARPNTTSTKALSRFRRTPDRAEIGVQGLCALRHRRLHAQMVAHHGGAALARSGAAAGPAEDAPSCRSRR